MLKQSLVLLSIISLNVFPSFACEELQEEKKSFFPTHFSEKALSALIKTGETKEEYKVFSISPADQAILESFSPAKMQIITGGSFPQRVKKSVENTKDYSSEYTLTGAYVGTNKITVRAGYDVLRPFLPDTEFSSEALCLHRLWYFGGNFSDQTGGEYRLNLTIARLFYICEVLELPLQFQGIYHQLNKKNHIKMGDMFFDTYLKEKGFSQDMRIKLIDHEKIVLEKDFYRKTIAYLQSRIYASLGIDEQILNSMYAGEGQHQMEAKYLEAMELAGRKAATHK